jgi:hypothetical protein
VGRILQRTTMKILIAAIALATPLAHAAEQPIHLTIAPGKAGEVCMPLEAGDTLAWRFKASAASDFNLHHHVGNDVLMPVQRPAVTEDQAEHAADRRNEWCLMWTAPAHKRVTVTGAWSVSKAAAK